MINKFNINDSVYVIKWDDWCIVSDTIVGMSILTGTIYYTLDTSGAHAEKYCYSTLEDLTLGFSKQFYKMVQSSLEREKRYKDLTPKYCAKFHAANAAVSTILQGGSVGDNNKVFLDLIRELTEWKAEAKDVLKLLWADKDGKLVSKIPSVKLRELLEY